MYRHVLASALAVSFVSAFAGCSADHEPEENTRSTTEALVAGVPTKAWLEIAPARLDAKGAAETSEAPSLACTPLQPLAPLADLTHTVSTRANGILGGVLGIVGTLLTRPPTTASGQHAVWGPLSGSEPAGIYVFEAERLGDGAIAYELHGAANESAPMLDLFVGATRFVADRHAGKVEINLEALHAVDPVRNQALTGRIAVEYSNLDGNVSIGMAFAGATGPETPPTDAQYNYLRRPDESGTFTFVADSMQKVIRVQSAWNGAGAGKSTSTEAVQCWAPNGAMIFAADPISGATQGDAACCPQ
jgi:hypothetical protein